MSPLTEFSRALRVPEGDMRGSLGGSHTVQRLLQTMTDVYRHIHPLSHAQVAAGASCAEQGHTFYPGTVGRGSLRLDLSFVFPAITSDQGVAAFVDD